MRARAENGRDELEMEGQDWQVVVGLKDRPVQIEDRNEAVVDGCTLL